MADYVGFNEPVGMRNMDYVDSYTAVVNDGVYGIEVVYVNGIGQVANYADEATRDAFIAQIDAKYKLGG